MMLRNFNKRNVLAARQLMVISQRGYYPDNVLMKREKGEYYSDPLALAERVVRVIALHDACIDPSSVTLSKSFEQCGLNALDMCEVFIGLERELDMEISEEDCEQIHTLNELVEFLAKSAATKM